MNLYQQLGGDAAIRALIDELHARALADPLLAPFLQNIDEVRLKGHQLALISQAIGGPHVYTGASLELAHAHLPIEQRHFDAFLGYLEDALRAMGAPQEAQDAMMSQVRPLSAVVVNTPTPSH